MSERKVLNKYFPPDFDPAKIPRRKMAADAQHKVRLMAPFSMRCSTCGDYVYKGKKFNARKEKVENEHYLGIQIFRFYIRCPKCSAEITFKTDPQNTDYVCEHGAQRNFEPWREETDVTELQRQEKEKEEENNPMKALENRTVDSKREMDILDALDEIRTKNAGNERVDVDAVLGRLQDSQRRKVERILKQQEDEDEAMAKAVFQSGSDGLFVRRLVEEEDEAGVSVSTLDVVPTPASSFAHIDSLESTKPVVSVSDWAPAVTKRSVGGATKRDSDDVFGLSIVATKSKKGKTSATSSGTIVAKDALVQNSVKGKAVAVAPTTIISGLATYDSEDSD
ncbi:CWC16 protein [Chytriomyces cf. hyalinus JEL632]|nr:CWC16 protein [Chytriomyces cf. hyalinus JEL632]